MKNIISALLALALSCSVAYAANTATAQTTLPIQIGKDAVGVTPYVVTIDTTSSDLTIVTPDSGKMACVAGLNFSDSTAANLTWKDGSTSLVTWELAANQGTLSTLGEGIVLCTTPGNALKINVSAVISTMIIYVFQATRLNLN